MNKIYVKIPCVDILEDDDGYNFINTFFIVGLTKDVDYVESSAYEVTNYTEIRIGINNKTEEYDELYFYVKTESVDEVMTMICEALNKLELTEKSET